jgi:hypothetical protein
MEATMLKSYMRAGNFRRLLRHPQCPEALKAVKRLYSKVFGMSGSTPEYPEESEDFSPSDDKANYTTQNYLGRITYSRAKTHVGNSIVLYHVAGDPTAEFAGEIQKIKVTVDGAVFTIRRQGPLPRGVFDPFIRFPFFPARCYSSLLTNDLDTVPFRDVTAHGARFQFSRGRSVIVNLSRT